MPTINAEVFIPRWLSSVDFDKKKVRKVILSEARIIRKIARRLVARKAISSPGEMPGRVTGSLFRSIKVFSGKKNGMFAVVRPHKTAEMDVFHPGLLYLGSKRRLGKLAAGEGKGLSNRRARHERESALAARSASSSFIIEPRANYMEEAMTQRRYAARDAIAAAVKSALIPRG